MVADEGQSRRSDGPIKYQAREGYESWLDPARGESEPEIRALSLAIETQRATAALVTPLVDQAPHFPPRRQSFPSVPLTIPWDGPYRSRIVR